MSNLTVEKFWKEALSMILFFIVEKETGMIVVLSGEVIYIYTYIYRLDI